MRNWSSWTIGSPAQPRLQRPRPSSCHCPLCPLRLGSDDTPGATREPAGSLISQQRLPAPDLTAAPRLLGTDWLLLETGGGLSAEGGALFLSASIHHDRPCEQDLVSALHGPLARSVECSPSPRPTVSGLVLPPKLWRACRLPAWQDGFPLLWGRQPGSSRAEEKPPVF